MDLKSTEYTLPKASFFDYPLALTLNLFLRFCPYRTVNVIDNILGNTSA